MINYLCVILFLLILVLELHPKFPTQSLLTKFSLATTGISALLIIGKVEIAINFLLISIILFLFGFSFKYLFMKHYQRRLADL